jgi:putative hydrolase of the HAD superfamily
MSDNLRGIIRAHCRPASPVPTGEQPRLKQLSGIRAVLFDVYGTMFVSASGDVGTAADAAQAASWSAALASVGIDCGPGEPNGADLLLSVIRRHHAAAHQVGIRYPEVEIRDVWQDVLQELRTLGDPIRIPENVDFDRLAVEYEVRANPVWPMPDVRECLQTLRDADIRLGIVSNAQFFTPELFPALLGEELDGLGFDRELRFYSYRYRQAKPGTYLYERAVEALSSLEIDVDEVVYVGNDLLNDVAPARQLGLRTALFAGDKRSLRWRRDDERVRGVTPDLVVTEFRQLPECIGHSETAEKKVS